MMIVLHEAVDELAQTKGPFCLEPKGATDVPVRACTPSEVSTIVEQWLYDTPTKGVGVHV